MGFDGARSSCCMVLSARANGAAERSEFVEKLLPIGTKSVALRRSRAPTGNGDGAEGSCAGVSTGDSLAT